MGQEQIAKIYEQIFWIGFYCTDRHDSRYIEKVKEMMEPVTGFIQWFLAENLLGLETSLYEALQRNLVAILNDMTEALQYQDRVLMMDALEQGVAEYLKMFLSEEELEEIANANIFEE